MFALRQKAYDVHMDTTNTRVLQDIYGKINVQKRIEFQEKRIKEKEDLRRVFRKIMLSLL